MLISIIKRHNEPPIRYCEFSFEVNKNIIAIPLLHLCCKYYNLSCAEIMSTMDSFLSYIYLYSEIR